MTTGFVQLNPDVDATGKQLDNDVVAEFPGAIVSDNLGNLTQLATTQYYFRERVTNADPVDPKGIANVRNDTGLNIGDYGLTVRMPPGQADLQTIAALLLDIDTNIAALAGTVPLANVGGANPVANYVYPITALSGTSVQSPGVPRQQVADTFGRSIVVHHAPRGEISSNSITITSTTAAQTLIAALGANVYADLVAVIAINTSATATEVDLSDGTQTVPMYVPAGDMRGISLGGVLIKATTVNTAWTATTLTSVASVKVYASYVQNRIS